MKTAESPDDAARSGPCHILHLEDDLWDRQLIKNEVEAEGVLCGFTYASTRDEFQSALERGGFDLILADFALPGFDGSSALAMARKARPDVPYVVVSGTIGERRAIETLKCGAMDYVLKDHLQDLGPALRRALQLAAVQSERKKFEERFRELAAHIRDVFWIMNPDTHEMAYVSPAYEIVWGRDVPGLLAQPGSWLESVVDEDREKVLAGLRQLSNGVAHKIEYRIVRPDGATRWIEDRGYPVKDSQGEAARAVGVAADITDRKRLEDELRQAQKMECIGQMAGGVAHDFNNMLTVINGHASLLLDQSDLGPVASEAVRSIYSTGERAARLTHRLLTFSRKKPLRSDVFDLNDVMAETLQLLQHLIGEHIALELRPSPDPAFIVGDSGMIEQVLVNLAVNARDAMPKGGSLCIGAQPVSIGEAGLGGHPQGRTGEFICLRVRDTGSGIPPEVLPRIFDPYFTTKGAGKGTGLGLAMTFGIVNQHQGWIEVETQAGVGTTFKLFLPRTRGEIVPRRVKVAEPAGLKGAGTILIVEDEISVRELGAAVLLRYGYTVLEAGSGKEAMEVWARHGHRIDLLLTDLVMPDDMTGHELAKELQAQKPGLPVIYSSGYGEDMACELFSLPKGVRFVPKPYRPQALAQAVRAALRGENNEG